MVIKSFVKSGNGRINMFPLVDSYRSSEEIRAIVNYWIRRHPKDSELGFTSGSHFVRAAIIRFDRELRQKEL